MAMYDNIRVGFHDVKVQEFFSIHRKANSKLASDVPPEVCSTNYHHKEEPIKIDWVIKRRI